MSEKPVDSRERLHDLLIDKAVFGISASEEEELQELLRANPDIKADDLDRLVTMLDMTALPQHLPSPPPALIAMVRSQAPTPVTASPSRASYVLFRKRELVAWVTAAVCLMVAVFSWNRQKTEDTRPGIELPPVAKQDPVGESVAKKVVPTLSQQRDELLLSPEGVLHVQLMDTVDRQDATAIGDIVWSPVQQRGFLRIKGLPSNDPSKSQYQLWLVEASPMHHETINGGVFNVDQQTRELIVPIRADHFVKQPNIFVISIEPPGGSPDLTAGGYPLIAKVDD